MRRRSGLIVFGFVLAGVARAFAQDVPSESLSLQWSAPSSCPDALQVSREIDTLLQGGTPQSRTPVSAQVQIRMADPSRWLVEIRTKRGALVGERKLSASNCESASHAVALILAIAIDPTHVAEPVPIATVSSLAEAPAVPVEPFGSVTAPMASITAPMASITAPMASVAAPMASVAAPMASASVVPAASAVPIVIRSRNLVEYGTPSEPKPPRVMRLWGIGIDAGFDSGALPEPGLGIGFHGNRRVLNYWLELGARYWPKSRGLLANSELGGDIDLYEISPRVGYVFARNYFDIVPKFGIDWGAIGGQGTGVNRPSDTQAMWLALHPSVDFRVLLGDRVGLGVDIGAVMPLRRDNFVLDGLGRVHRASVVSLRIGLGAEFRF